MSIITALDVNDETIHHIAIQTFISFVPCTCGLEHCRCNNGTCICSSGDEDRENTKIMDLNGIRVSAQYYEGPNTVLFANASGCSFQMERIIPMLQFIYKQQQQQQSNGNRNNKIKFDKSLGYNILKANLIDNQKNKNSASGSSSTTSTSTSGSSSTTSTSNKNINIYIDTQSFCYSGPDFGQSRRGLRPASLLNPITTNHITIPHPDRSVRSVSTTNPDGSAADTRGHPVNPDTSIKIFYSIVFINDINTVVVSNASSKSYSYEETLHIIDILGNKLNVNPSHIADAKRVLQICENTSYEIECNPDCHCLQPHPTSVKCDTLTSSQYADAAIYCDYDCEFPCRGRGHPVSPDEIHL
jgi:hypothetical protein